MDSFRFPGQPLSTWPGVVRKTLEETPGDATHRSVLLRCELTRRSRRLTAPGSASPAGGEAPDKRHGTTSLFAALDTSNTAAWSSAGSPAMSKPTRLTISRSASSWTPPQPRRLSCPRWHVHFTPTSASGLNADQTGCSRVDCRTGKGDPSLHRHRQHRSQTYPMAHILRWHPRFHQTVLPENRGAGRHARSRPGYLHRAHQGRLRPGLRREAYYRDQKPVYAVPAAAWVSTGAGEDQQDVAGPAFA